jgi:hypothetical protein
MDFATIRHSREVAHLVLRWYLEPVSGIVCLAGSSRSVFDVRVLQFQHDVDVVMDRTLNPSEQAFLFLLHSGGMTPTDCVVLAPVPMKRPLPSTVASLLAAFPDDRPTRVWLTQVAVELKLGRALIGAGLDRVASYFSRGYGCH